MYSASSRIFHRGIDRPGCFINFLLNHCLITFPYTEDGAESFTTGRSYGKRTRIGCVFYYGMGYNMHA